jgi:Uma2 family endonuclease
MNLALKRKMTVAEFLEWAEAQPEGDFELVDGQIVAIVQERALHNLAKMAVARALQDAVAAAGLDCTVYTDGKSIRTRRVGRMRSFNVGRRSISIQ